MKRIFLTVFALLAGAMLFAASPAHAEKAGVYVAPKFSVGFMNWQAKGEAAADSENTLRMTFPPVTITRNGRDFFEMDGGSSNTVLGGNLAVGYDFYHRFNVPLRAELEYGIYGGGSGDADSSIRTDRILPGGLNLGATARGSFGIDIVNIQTLMANVWWDFRNSSAFTPYVGGGIGLSFIHAKGDLSLEYSIPGNPSKSFSGDLGGRTTTNFAWQLGAGCAWNITDTVALDLGYRFMSLGSARTAEENFSYTMTTAGVTTNMNVRAQGKAENIYMHQVGLGIRFTF